MLTISASASKELIISVKQREAKYVRYKQNRTGDKPLLLKELADWVKVKYKEKCVVSQGPRIG